ncbi:MAG: glycosyltransferase [Candidatus Chisholmbacteria bacterium]|nr:glycosyltransferase [Candidatus Chisholmbacteria bacterium]
MRSALAQPSVSIVLPTHNELRNLKLLIPQIVSRLKNKSIEVIVVDDASTDGSKPWLLKQSKNNGVVIPIFGNKLLGIGKALKRGYSQAKGDCIVSIDADLSFDSKIIPKLVSEVKQGYDLVLASRHTVGGYYEAKTWDIKRKRLISYLSNLILRTLIPIGVSDFSANCRAMKKSLWRKLVLHEKTNIWLIEMIVASAIGGARIRELPVSFIDRRFGISKLRLGREIVSSGYRVVGLVVRYWINRLKKNLTIE